MTCCCTPRPRIENDAAVAEEFRDRYRCFVVDEYQDVTPLQQRVLSAWLGDRDDLTVVGDANQTIYSFTGATPRFLLDFSRRFPDATVVRLERDYRSTPQVVSLANQVIAAARGRVAGSKLQLFGQRDAGPGAVVPRASRRDRRGRRGGGVDRPADRIRHPAIRDRGALPGQCAVRGLRGGVDRGGHRLSGSRRRGVLQPSGDQAGAVGAAARRRARSRDGPEGALPDVVRADPGTAGADGRGTGRHPGPGPLGGADRAGRTGRRRSGAAPAAGSPRRCSPSSGCAPTRGTHRWCRASRWPRCTPPRDSSGTRCSWSGWPTARYPSRTRWRTAPRASAVEEERRLLYVGITRARMHLALSWALARSPGGRQSRKPSRFLNGIAPQTRADPAPNRSRRNEAPQPAAGSATRT